MFPLAQKMLSGTIRWVASGTTPPPILTFLSRDGDVVAIRVSADGEDLIIKDNHSLDASATPKPAVSEVATLDF